MTIEKQPFTRYHEDGEERPDTFTVRLNKQEREDLENLKKIFQQTKDSTAVKQALAIAYSVVIHDKKIAAILEIVTQNKRRNKRLGITDFEQM